MKNNHCGFKICDLDPEYIKTQSFSFEHLYYHLYEFGFWLKNKSPSEH